MLFLNFFYNSAQCETEQGGQVVRKPRIQEFKNSRSPDTPRRVPQG
jgi:hypothetical protein